MALADVRGQQGPSRRRVARRRCGIRAPRRREADWTTALPQIAADLGGLDGLVNNAAILHMGALEEIPLDDARTVFLDVNLFGVFLGIRQCVPLLRDAGGGSIVNIGSIDGMHGMNSIVMYSASKWGVRGLSKSAAIELGRFARRVNTINPSLGSPEMFAPFSPTSIGSAINAPLLHRSSTGMACRTTSPRPTPRGWRCSRRPTTAEGAPAWTSWSIWGSPWACTATAYPASEPLPGESTASINRRTIRRARRRTDLEEDQRREHDDHRHVWSQAQLVGGEDRGGPGREREP